MSDLAEYYGAAVLLWADTNGRRNFTEHELVLCVNEMPSTSETPKNILPHLDSVANLNLGLTWLKQCDFINVFYDEFGPDCFFVTLEGNLDEIRNANYPDTPVSKAAHFGAAWLIIALQNIRDGSNFSNNQDNEITQRLNHDNWQPLPIDREDPLFKVGLKAVEEALKTIEADNGYAATEPEERNAIIASAKGTVQALKDGYPSKGTVSATLIIPFKYLAKKFGDGIIGAAAKTIWEFGIKLLTFGS